MATTDRIRRIERSRKRPSWVAGLALLVLLGLGACAPSVVGQPAEEPTLLASRVGTGGLCPVDTCRDDLRVLSDGTWTWDGGTGRSADGELSDAELDALTDAISGTRLEDAPEFTDTCPIAFDGLEYTYLWVIDGTEHRVSSCEVVVDPEEPLVAILDRLARRVAS